MKIVKIATLILSFIFVVCVSARVVKAEKIDGGIISVNIRHADGGSSGRAGGQEKKYSAIVSGDGTSTPSLIVYNATVWLAADYDGDGHYRTVSYFFDVDTNSSEPVNYYTVVYERTGHDWYTFDSLKSDVNTLKNGYSPKEGIYYDFYFLTGYKNDFLDIKIEVYYENGELACTFGPDEDSDLSQAPIEAAEYDVKKDPFIPSPTPSSTPTPIPTADEIKLDDSLEGGKLVLLEEESANVSAEALSGGETISGAEIKVETNGKAASVSPSAATTDENGLAEFTITAKKKGNAKITFSSGEAKKILRVKVK